MDKSKAQYSQTPRAAAIRHWDATKQEWKVTNPRDALYSNLIFTSTHYYDGTHWVRVAGGDGE